MTGGMKMQRYISYCIKVKTLYWNDLLLFEKEQEELTKAKMINCKNWPHETEDFSCGIYKSESVLSIQTNHVGSFIRTAVFISFCCSWYESKQGWWFPQKHVRLREHLVCSCPWFIDCCCRTSFAEVIKGPLSSERAVLWLSLIHISEPTRR